VKRRAGSQSEFVANAYEMSVGADDAQCAYPGVAPDRDAPEQCRAGAGVQERTGQGRCDARVGEDVRSREHAGQGRQPVDFGKLCPATRRAVSALSGAHNIAAAARPLLSAHRSWPGLPRL